MKWVDCPVDLPEYFVLWFHRDQCDRRTQPVNRLLQTTGVAVLTGWGCVLTGLLPLLFPVFSFYPFLVSDSITEKFDLMYLQIGTGRSSAQDFSRKRLKSLFLVRLCFSLIVPLPLCLSLSHSLSLSFSLSPAHVTHILVTVCVYTMTTLLSKKVFVLLPHARVPVDLYSVSVRRYGREDKYIRL